MGIGEGRLDEDNCQPQYESRISKETDDAPTPGLPKLSLKDIHMSDPVHLQRGG